MAIRAGLIGIVSGLIIGAAIFIYVAVTLLNQLRTAYFNGFPTRALGDASTNAVNDTWNVSVAAAVKFNTSVDGLVTMSFTIGTLMAVAAIAVVGFWIVRSVIGGT